MERKQTLLFLCSLMAVSLAVQSLVSGSFPGDRSAADMAMISQPPKIEAREAIHSSHSTATTTKREASTIKTKVTAAGLSNRGGYSAEYEAQPQANPGDASVETESRGVSSMALAFNQRGVWLTDGDGARVQNVSHGPIPIQSALVPILMYHHVKPIDSKLQNDPAGRELTVPPAEFEGQMRYLIERGFKAISMAELALLLQGRAQLQPRSVIFTFDDGYEDNYLYAFQILQRYGLSGTFFIVTGLVGLDGYMTWSQLSRMLASGMEIGSHLTTHLDLAKLSAIQRDRELRGSKQILEQKMGVSVRALSYPSGSYNSDVVASARKAGYEIAVTTRYGAIIDGSRPMELPRIRVSGHETSASFKAKIEQYFPASDVVSR